MSTLSLPNTLLPIHYTILFLMNGIITTHILQQHTEWVSNHDIVYQIVRSTKVMVIPAVSPGVDSKILGQKTAWSNPIF